MTSTTSDRVFVRHSVALPPWRPAVNAASRTVVWLATTLLRAVLAGVAVVRDARSVLLVGGGLLCFPVAVAGLAGVWWGVLTLGPTLIGVDWATRDDDQ